MIIPDIERANALLIGGNWTVVRKAYPAKTDGWITLETSGFAKINVRASSVEGVRFNDLPPVLSVVANTPWS